MGRKRKFDSTSSTNNNKKVKYSSLPENHKKQWILDENLNLVGDYNDLLNWLCERGTLDGFDFDGIKSLRCNDNGYPLVEVEVLYLKKSYKFLISRATLYILAFFSTLYGWRIFKDSEFQIDMGDQVTLCLKRNAKYKTTPWKILGPKAMIDGLKKIDSSIHMLAAEGCEVFAVHLCEATRITLIRSRISGCMIPSVSTLMPPDSEENIILGSNRCVDIMPLLKPLVVDFSLTVQGDDQVKSLIKKFKQLCKAWIVYSLSRKILCPLDQKIADMCGIKTIRTLRNSISVLSNTNLEKVVDEYRKKFVKGQCPSAFGKSDFNFMQSEVQRLLKND